MPTDPFVVLLRPAPSHRARAEFAAALRARITEELHMREPAPRFEGITPYLHYENAATMLEWLARVFGFEERSRYVDAEGVVREAEMLVGDGEIWMAGRDPGYWAEHGGGPDQLVLVWVDDVDAQHARVLAAGVEADAPVDQPYGVRSFNVTDPQGYQWGFMRRLDTGFQAGPGGLEEILPD